MTRKPKLCHFLPFKQSHMSRQSALAGSRVATSRYHICATPVTKSHDHKTSSTNKMTGVGWLASSPLPWTLHKSPVYPPLLRGLITPFEGKKGRERRKVGVRTDANEFVMLQFSNGLRPELYSKTVLACTRTVCVPSFRLLAASSPRPSVASGETGVEGPVTPQMGTDGRTDSRRPTNREKKLVRVACLLPSSSCRSCPHTRENRGQSGFLEQLRKASHLKGIMRLKTTPLIVKPRPSAYGIMHTNRQTAEMSSNDSLRRQ